MKKRLFAALFLCTPFYANASVISGYGVQASASTANKCPSYCQSGVDPIRDGDMQFASEGGEFVQAATASETSYATGQASAALTGDTYLPELKVYSSAGVGAGGFASAFGVQGFTYTGTDPAEITLDINLHGLVDELSNGAYSDAYLSANVAVVTGNDMEWYPSFATLVYEVATGDLLGSEYLSLGDTNGTDANTSGAISFEVTSGLDFYVIASISAGAKNGFADGWHTLSMSFDDPTGLMAATGGGPVSAVPAPAALWLFGTGLVGFVGAKRRKSQKQAA